MRVKKICYHFEKVKCGRKYKFSKMYEHLKRTTYSLLQLTNYNIIHNDILVGTEVLNLSFCLLHLHGIFILFSAPLLFLLIVVFHTWSRVEKRLTFLFVLKMVVHAILLFVVRWKHWIGQSAIMKRLPTLSIRKWNDELNFVGYY